MKNKIIILIIMLSFWRCTVSTCECCKTETIFDSIMLIMASTNHNIMSWVIIHLQLTEGDLLGVWHSSVWIGESTANNN